jgi:hypothetical protein
VKKWIKRILVAALLLAVILWVGGRLLLRHWTAKPPPLPVDTAILQARPETRAGRVWLGQSWAGQREGLPVVRLKGSPLEMGYAHGVLTKDRMQTLERDFLQMIRGYVPEDWKLNLLRNYIIYRNRRLSEYIPLDYRLQIYGTTLGCPDVHPEQGNYYNRMLNYHAAHDISYMMIDNPLVSKAGCTAFAAWSSATANGHLITGRNFDWEAAETFSRDRVVILCEPDNRIPFISLAWAGMTGVISGMNRAGISVTINGAPSSLPRETATPVAIVAREVMEQAHNLDEALKIVRDAKVFVSTLWLIGSRADGKFVVVEKTPAATHLREPENGTIVCGNHFQTPGTRDDSHNQNYMAEATSVSRSERMAKLVSSHSGRINAAAAAAFLRDRDLPDGTFPGHGHRGTINALIATHATVMDLTSGIFWAASPPNQLGKFVAFDVKNFDRELPSLTIAPDELLASGGLERAKQAAQALNAGRQALKAGKPESALTQADAAEKLNPGYYQNAQLKGQALLKLNRTHEAAAALEQALERQPAFLSEKRELQESLKRITESK